MTARGFHLARRFAGSLSPAPPPPTEETWARSQLLPGEVAVWLRLSNADRRHCVGVGCRVAADLGERASRPVLAAALLHDAGKLVSGLGTFARVGATVAGELLGHARAPSWAQSQRRVPRRVGQYLLHAEL